MNEKQIPDRVSVRPESIRAFYDEFSDSRMQPYLHEKNFRIEKAIDRILPFVEIENTVLEIGCGLGLVTERVNTLDPVTRETELRTLQKLREHRGIGTHNQTLATINPQRRVTNRDPEAGPQREGRELPKDAPDKKWRHKKDRISHDEAFRRHWHEWHDRNWWHDHCDRIVFVTNGYYFLDGSYWYPAYGYDPLPSYYDYDGPIFTYSNLLPDEVIGNVQTALQDAGYYVGPITGSLSIDTRAALANFQRDYGLPITGAIDEATVEALGLDQAGDSYNFQTDQGY